MWRGPRGTLTTTTSSSPSGRPLFSPRLLLRPSTLHAFLYVPLSSPFPLFHSNMFVLLQYFFSHNPHLSNVSFFLLLFLSRTTQFNLPRSRKRTQRSPLPRKERPLSSASTLSWWLAERASISLIWLLMDQLKVFCSTPFSFLRFIFLLPFFSFLFFYLLVSLPSYPQFPKEKGS